MSHKAGFVNIIGSPNVGKSTLMNQLVGEKLSIITSKAQTTRHRIMGIVNGKDFQIVYSDTPGVVKSSYKLHDSMMNSVNTAIKDADILIFITDVFENEMNHVETLKKITSTDIPVLLLINKVDLKDEKVVEERINYWHEKVPKAKIAPISALLNFNCDTLFNKILELLPESPPYFPKDDLTDRPMRFFVSEIIREKILKNYSKEVPYSCEVVVDEFKDDKDICRIKSTIYVVRESQKGIVIGHQGSKIKRVGTHARQDLEEMLGKQVHLELYVKVQKNWRDKESDLKKFGY